MRFHFVFNRDLIGVGVHWEDRTLFIEPLPFCRLLVDFKPEEEKLSKAENILALIYNEDRHDQRAKMLTNHWLVTHFLNTVGERYPLTGWENALLEEMCERVEPGWSKK